MILHKMAITNFRQFRGTQKIEFTSGKKRNVTVIFGENGRGKTGIYRALLFCLYGEKQLSQDAQIDQSELYLVNKPEMEANSGNRKPVIAGVKLKFSHAGRDYEIERTLKGILHEGEVVQEDVGVRLVVTEGGNSRTIKDSDEVDALVNSILARGLREYFLFDGEKIERLTRASTEQRREISAGIRKLLDIDTLETAARSTDRLRRYFDAEVETRATGELARVVKQMREYDERCTELEERIREIESELDLANIEKKQVDAELEKINEIRELLTARNALEEKTKDLKGQLKDLLEVMKSQTGNTALLLTKGTSEKTFTEIDMRKQKHEIPSEIRRDLIDRLVSEGRCICGSPLDKGSEQERCILLWRNRTTDLVTEDSMLDLWRYLGAVRSRYDDISVTAESSLQKYAVARNELHITERGLVQIQERIGKSDRADASKLDKHRENIERKIFKLEAEQSKGEEEIRILRDEVEKLKQQRKDIELEKGIQDEMSMRAELAAATSKALKVIHEEFTGEARDQIGLTASKYFEQLLDEEGKQTLRNIVVNPDYSIQVYDSWRKPFLANISAGQRQIMSIAFIASLANAASGADVLEMPLFMDTPFGRLSHEHRRNLLEKVPEWCTQWILLATDTEFGRFEANILRNTGRWGKFYSLVGAGAGSTNIRDMDVDQALQMLKEEAEVN